MIIINWSGYTTVAREPRDGGGGRRRGAPSGYVRRDGKKLAGGGEEATGVTDLRNTLCEECLAATDGRTAAAGEDDGRKL